MLYCAHLVSICLTLLPGAYCSSMSRYGPLGHQRKRERSGSPSPPRTTREPVLSQRHPTATSGAIRFPKPSRNSSIPFYGCRLPSIKTYGQCVSYHLTTGLMDNLSLDDALRLRQSQYTTDLGLLTLREIKAAARDKPPRSLTSSGCVATSTKTANQDHSLDTLDSGGPIAYPFCWRTRIGEQEYLRGQGVLAPLGL